jgi:long-subunit fatty acid transport protein
VYPASGFGATYSKAIEGQDLSLSVAQFEASPALSFEVTKGLSLGLAYRFTYTRETAHQPAPGSTIANDLALDGVNLFGLHAGVYYRPIDALHLAFTYRTRVDSKISGTTERAGSKYDTTSQFNTPHRFRLAASVTPPGVPLLIAIDARYLLYADSNETTDIIVDTPIGKLTTTQRLDWRNTFTIGTGVEYKIASMVAARVGYSLSQSATPDSTANAFTPPPGVIHGFHFGAGLQVSAVDIDIGGAYAASSRRVPGNTENMVLPGEYQMKTLVFALSATYRL